MRGLLVLGLVVVVGCGDDDAGVDAGARGAVARFEPGSEGALDWGAVPFPSDLYLDAEGHPRLGALPTRLSDAPRFVAIRGLLAQRTGLCSTCNVYFAIDGEIDPASVPASVAPGAVPSASDALVLADVDPTSPERGRLFPLRVEADATRGRIAIRPVRGIALHRNRRYAAAITSAIRAADGTPLRATDAFLAVRDGATDASPAIQRAQTLLDPALDELEALGVARESIVAATVFTTGDPTRDLLAARALVHAAPAPVATVDRVWSTPAEIDALLGTPADPDAPGIDVPPAAGTEGTRAIRHDTVSKIVTGRFRAPRLVTGTGLDLGEPLRDATTGALAAGEPQDVTFVLIVPTGADVTRLPVVIEHHGFNASRITGFVIADTAGRAGAAVLAIDAFQHGDRASSAEDTVHTMRGDVAGPDGFAETDILDVSGRVFGIAGAPDDMRLYPGYPLGAFLQFAADVMATVRLAKEGDASAIAAADPSLAGLAFDPDRIFYVGNSMGSVVGQSVLVAESDIAAFTFNVQPGSMVETLAEGAQFRGLSESVFLPLLGVTGSFDEITRSIMMDPTIDLFRWAMEPVDPLALSTYFVRDRVATGAHPDLLFQLASLDELAAPSASESTLAAAGIPGIGTFEHAPIAPVALPVVANLTTPTGPITAAAHRYDPCGHGVLELTRQSSSYELPLVPPLRMRADPIVVENPIVAVHDQIETFFRTRIENGRGEIH